MIIGIGSDIVNIERIEKLLAQNSDIFLKKIFTSTEIAAIKKITNTTKVSGYVANRFAAKEAFAKALGTGIGKYVSFQDLTILKNSAGKPYFELSKKLIDYLKETHGQNINIHLSMANEHDVAQAFVLIESLA